MSEKLFRYGWLLQESILIYICIRLEDELFTSFYPKLNRNAKTVIEHWYVFSILQDVLRAKMFQCLYMITRNWTLPTPMYQKLHRCKSVILYICRDEESVYRLNSSKTTSVAALVMLSNCTVKSYLFHASPPASMCTVWCVRGKCVENGVTGKHWSSKWNQTWEETYCLVGSHVQKPTYKCTEYKWLSTIQT